MWLDGEHEHVSLTGDLSNTRRNERMTDATSKLLEPFLGNIERGDARRRAGPEGTLGQCAAQISDPDNAERQATAHEVKCTMQALGHLNPQEAFC